MLLVSTRRERGMPSRLPLTFRSNGRIEVLSFVDRPETWWAVFSFRPMEPVFRQKISFRWSPVQMNGFRPVVAEVGPDGNLWIADWYNFIIQHNPTPSPERGGYAAQKGPGNAHVNPHRDKQHGRIYRLIWEGANQSERPDLENASAEQLVAVLDHDNLFWRSTAQRLLVEKGRCFGGGRSPGESPVSRGRCNSRAVDFAGAWSTRSGQSSVRVADKQPGIEAECDQGLWGLIPIPCSSFSIRRWCPIKIPRFGWRHLPRWLRFRKVKQSAGLPMNCSR